MPIIFSFGNQPVSALTNQLDKAGRVTAADMLYALNRQKTRILDRTAHGQDINGSAFAPYSTKGPYYYYPGAAGRSRMFRIAFQKQRGGAARRFAKKVGAQRTRLGVKFASYAAFKQSLGRSVVDLMGASAPHMLQALVVQVGGTGATPVTQGTIGIYGDAADRAEGHNTGAGHLPKREFFGFGSKDEDLISADIESLMSARMSKILS